MGEAVRSRNKPAMVAHLFPLVFSIYEPILIKLNGLNILVKLF